jgi:hypothetical protein
MPVHGTNDEPANRKDSLLLHDTESKRRYCFTAETPVWVDGRLMPICNVTAGRHAGGAADSFLLAGGAANAIETVQVHPGQFDDCYDVVLQTGERIGVVGSHRFGLQTGRWVPVEQLRPGMCLRSLGGGVVIAQVVKRPTPYVGTVYNLKIADADAYFVGAAGVVVRDY